MNDIQKKIADLSPEKRARLEQALRARLQQPKAVDAPLLLETTSPSEPNALRSSYKQFYDSVSAQLNSSEFGKFSFFLNYGYVSDESPEFAPVHLPDQFINRNSVKLVLEVVSDVAIDNKRVLDVGCGRGGTLYTLKTFFKPASLTGLDLSSTAIEFDRKAHGDARTTFYEGDAENLPFADASFDVVTNVESSHSYPNIQRFYSQVHRVLAPGGYFCYTDALSRPQFVNAIAYFDHIGMDVIRDRNITRNVLLSCDQVSVTRVQAFDSRNDQGLMGNFLATPGSQVYEEMRSGNWEYRILNLRKRA